jgi:lipopolysaccharide transport system ATP-binding protein
MGNVVLRADTLSKRYTIAGEQPPYRTLRDDLTALVTRPFRRHDHAAVEGAELWALKDVSLEIGQGEVVGIIGRNGAGKSTLLKIFSRVTEPTSGSAEIHGRVGSLLEVGVGFHGELTGRENIYLSGAILGMKRAEIARKFDEIVSFAEVEKFIDTPAKHYSSGMYVRLAFAVAIHLEPEILLIDEVLAVGDAAFQRKCLGKIGDVAKQGRTILFVSHYMPAIESLCTLAHRLDGGRLVQSGTTQEVVDAYLSSVPTVISASIRLRKDRRGSGKLRFTGMDVAGADGSPASVIQCSQDVEFSVGYTSDDADLKNVYMAIDIFALSGQCMLSLNNEMVGVGFGAAPSRGQLCCRIERFPLAPGHYTVTLFCRVNGTIADWLQQAAVLTVEPGDFYGTGRLPTPTLGGVMVRQCWRLENQRQGIRNGFSQIVQSASLETVSTPDGLTNTEPWIAPNGRR